LYLSPSFPFYWSCLWHDDASRKGFC